MQFGYNQNNVTTSDSFVNNVDNDCEMTSPGSHIFVITCHV